MPVTIRDIARKLDLSIAAVSRALGGYPDISEATRQRVLETARQMGYVPNRAARQLRRRRADSIGYIIPSSTPRFADPFFTEFIAGLGDETSRHPFDLTISIAAPGEEAEKQLYETWVQSHKVDGFILTHLRMDDARVALLLELGFPFAVLESVPGAGAFPRVDIDRRGGVAGLVGWLAGRGFRRIATIGGPADLQIQVSQQEGYRQGLGDAGLPYLEALQQRGDLTSSGGYAAAQRLLALPQSPDAILCINDETAFGVLHALRELGIRAGEQVAVTGFDGVAVSAFSDPPLTTLDIPVYDIATRMVQMLAAGLDGAPGWVEPLVITPRLLKRASTGGTHP